MDKNLDDTTEFYFPKRGLSVQPYIDAEEKQGIHHIGRYEWAATIIPQNCRILDIGCGAGYGVQIYTDAHPSALITGVDYDPRAIDVAKTQFPTLDFRVGDMESWKDETDSALGQFDCITSFDTIEHLLHREIALMRLSDNLSDAGVLLLSTPCGHSKTLLNPAWEHHKIEYSHTDLYALLGRFFQRILTPEDDMFPNKEFWRNVVNSDRVRYLNLMNPVVCKYPIRAT